LEWIGLEIHQGKEQFLFGTVQSIIGPRNWTTC
jgi:hypothetical protein